LRREIVSEQIRAVEMIVIDYICDECGKGKMLQNGEIVYMSYPAQIPHKCDNCGAKKTFYEQPYPRTGYREIS